MAKINAPVTGQDKLDTLESRLIILSLAVKDLGLQIPGLYNKDLLVIWKGSFNPTNLARLRSYTRYWDCGNITILKDGYLETGLLKADLKPL